MKTMIAAVTLAIGLMGASITAADAYPHHGHGWGHHHGGHRHCTSWGHHHHCRGWGW